MFEECIKIAPVLPRTFKKMFIFDSSLRYTAPGEGNGNPLWNSCLENSIDRGAWWDSAHRVAKSRTRLSDQHTHTRCTTVIYTLLKLENASKYMYILHTFQGLSC